MSCEECHDTGYVVKLDLMHATRVKQICPKCHGIKERPKLNLDGIRMVHMPCQVYLWQEFKDGRPIATLELWIMPVFENGIPQHVKENPLAKPRPRIYIQIRDMHTKPKYRRTGIMDRLLIMALQDRRVEWFETSWNDSTEEGRSFLLHRGFKREDDKLVFRPPEEPCQN